MAEITPMMKQYLEIKEQNKDSILFFRLGDFYEMFNEDAQLASRELDLTLTTRDRGKAAEDQTPMCGIPYHSSDAYIARLIAKGYKVAICEQTEDPALAKGLVKRDIIRVITPGTVIDSACLDDRRGNFLCGIFLDGQNAGAAFCDMTTGHTHVTAFSGDDRAEHLYNELSRFSPAEAVLSAGAYDNGELVEYLRDKLSCAVERGENRFELKACEKAIRAQFGEERFASLPRNNPAASLALGALLSYLHETQKTDLSYIKDLEYYEQGRFMELDLSARRNLELTETIRAKEKRGSLLWVLDKTKTAMGARNLRAWLTRPLRDVAAIERRLGAVEALTKNTVAREELILSLSGISDMERLIGRIAYGTAGGRDFASLRNSIERITEVKAQLTAFTTGRLHELDNELDTLTDVAQSIRDTLIDEPPFSVREGGFIRKGFNAEVDRLHEILSGGKGLLADIETREKEKTGIRTLNRAGTLERRGYANAAIRDLDKGYLVQRVNGLHVSDGDREGALVRLHGEMQGDGDLVRLLLIRANEQKAGMQLDRPRRFSALPIMPLDIERSKSFADWPQDQHDFWMYRLGNMALVQGPEDQLDRLSEYPARRDRMLLRADSRRFPLTNQLKDFADCTPALLEARQEESVRLIVEYWGIRYDKDARDLTKQNVDELSKTSPRPSHSSRRVTIRQVIDAGLLVPGERLVWDRPRKGERWFATVTENGRLRLDDGSEYPTPTAAARAAAGGRRGGGLDVWKRTRNGQKLSDIWKQFRLQAQ